MSLFDERAIDWGQYKQAPAGPCELFFRILCSTKGSPRFKNALPYIVSCVHFGLCSTMSYKTAIEQILGFDENSINAGLRDETLLLEKFTRELEMTNSPNCAGFLLSLSKKYLSTAIEKFREGEGLTIEFLRSDVPDIEVVRNLRAKSIKALCMLLHSKEWAAEASDAILRCIELGFNPEKLRSTARERKESDLKALLVSLEPPYPMNSKVIKLFVSAKEAASCFGWGSVNDLDEVIPKGAADYWTVLRCRDFYEEIPDFTQTWTVQRMVDVSALAGLFALENQQMAFEASSVISYMLSRIPGNSVLRSGIIAALEAFVSDGGGPQIRLFGDAVTNAVKFAGHDSVIAFCREFHQEDLELSIMLHDREIKADLVDKQRLIELSGKSKGILSIEEVASLLGDDRAFGKAYIESISAELASDADLAIRFFRMDKPSKKTASDLNLLFGEKYDLLRKLYLLYAGYEHFDFFGAVFLYLWQKDRSIIDDLIASEADSDNQKSRVITQRLGLVSLVPDACSEMERVVGLIVKHSQIGFAWFEVQSLLDRANPFLSSEFDVFNFALGMVIQHVADDAYVDAFQMLISGFDDAEREKFLIKALSQDCHGELIGHIPLRASTESCSAELGFGPHLRESANMLMRVSASLPNEICFARHRTWLAHSASEMRREAKAEDWRTFRDVW